MVKIDTSEGMDFEAYLAVPDGSPAPGIVLLQEIFGVNQVMRDIADSFARKGFVVICPDLFWRQEPGIQLTDQTQENRHRAMELYEGFDERKAVGDAAVTVSFLRKYDGCTGKVGAVGYCLGGKLAYLLASRCAVECAVSYYGVGIDKALEEATGATSPIILHIACNDQYCSPLEQATIHNAFDSNRSVTIHDYQGQGHAFARPGGEHYDEASAQLAGLRTLEFLHRELATTPSTDPAKGTVDFPSLWEEHVKYEFETRNYEDTLETMVDDAYVNHIPTLTGGVGKEQLGEFYSNRFIPQMPPDTEMTAVSRTVGEDRLVDEMIFSFTHTIAMDWMLPGIAPTGKRVEIPLVAIVHFRNGKLAHEHIYWDQASVLVQLGLLDPANLPVAGVETARKVLDNTIPSNALIERADRRKK